MAVHVFVDLDTDLHFSYDTEYNTANDVIDALDLAEFLLPEVERITDDLDQDYHYDYAERLNFLSMEIHDPIHGLCF